MRAAVYHQTGGPEVFRYEDVPDPVVHPGGVLVRVEAVSVQGGDVLNRAGGELAATPHIVGYQAAGTIVEVGAGVEDLRVGQRVVTVAMHGSHAELVSVPAASAWPVPDGLAIELAAGVPIEFGTAADCLFEFGRLVAGETVLVQAGAGGVGLAAIQLAKAAGAGLVVATASSDDRLEQLRAYGMDEPVNYATQDVPAEVRRLTDGRGVDLVVDPVGGRTLEGSVEALAYRGRISWVGDAGRDGAPDLGGLRQKNASVTGVFFGAELVVGHDRVRALVAGLLDRVAAGELEVVIDAEFPLAEAEAAHRHIESRRAFGRVLLKP